MAGQTNVIVISAPSGSGKTKLANLLMDRVGGLVFSISCTTRKLRGDERDGRDYYFITSDRFRAMVSAQAFLENAEVYGSTNLYGSPKVFLELAQASGKDLLLDIDVQGAKQLRKQMEIISVLIMPPSKQELERRLHGRGDVAEAVIERRLRDAPKELNGYAAYDYVVINQELEAASEQLNAIVLAARARAHGEASGAQYEEWDRLARSCRTDVLEQEIAGILKTFKHEEAMNG